MQQILELNDHMFMDTPRFTPCGEYVCTARVAESVLNQGRSRRFNGPFAISPDGKLAAQYI
jgi:hypothetical protein